MHGDPKFLPGAMSALHIERYAASDGSVIPVSKHLAQEHQYQEPPGRDPYFAFFMFTSTSVPST
jgi:hypothetical protein